MILPLNESIPNLITRIEQCLYHTNPRDRGFCQVVLLEQALNELKRVVAEQLNEEDEL